MSLLQGGEGIQLGNRFIFPAPEPSYTPQSYKRHLCWIPWNEVISPHRTSTPEQRAANSEGIPCLWFPAPKAATVILFFHANAEDLGMSFAVLKHMRDQFKVNVLAVEYPGYGLLHHMTPSEDGVYEVALTAFRFLVDEVNVRYAQIILFGRSLGSGPAVYLAAQYPVGGLILVSAFSSIKGAVQSIVGRLFAWTFKERFPNNRIIANVSCSTLFIHGECDGLIPAEHSLRLFKRCRARKLLITPPKMEHNSNLFGDASFLAVPAIHFFGFPGYYTSTPPRLPAVLFENPERRARMRSETKEDVSLAQPWLCGCLAKSDPHHLDVSFCRQEHSVEDITIRFNEPSAVGQAEKTIAALVNDGRPTTPRTTASASDPIAGMNPPEEPPSALPASASLQSPRQFTNLDAAAQLPFGGIAGSGRPDVSIGDADAAASSASDVANACKRGASQGGGGSGGSTSGMSAPPNHPTGSPREPDSQEAQPKESLVHQAAPEPEVVPACDAPEFRGTDRTDVLAPGSQM